MKKRVISTTTGRLTSARNIQSIPKSIFGDFTKRFAHRIPDHIPDEQMNKYIRKRKKKLKLEEKNK